MKLCPNCGSWSNCVRIEKVGPIGSKLKKQVKFGPNGESSSNWLQIGKVGKVGPNWESRSNWV